MKETRASRQKTQQTSLAAMEIMYSRPWIKLLIKTACGNSLIIQKNMHITKRCNREGNIFYLNVMPFY